MAANYPSTPIRQKGERTKRKETSRAKRVHTKAEDEYLSRLVSLGCVLCSYQGIFGTPAEAHHTRTGVGAGQRSSHFDAIPLCPPHHRTGGMAFHVMGRRAWERFHKVSESALLAITKGLLK